MYATIYIVSMRSYICFYLAKYVQHICTALFYDNNQKIHSKEENLFINGILHLPYKK